MHICTYIYFTDIGNWGTWMPWEACSCDVGTRTRRRFCNNPAPAPGRYCEGKGLVEKPCQPEECYNIPQNNPLDSPISPEEYDKIRESYSYNDYNSPYVNMSPEDYNYEDFNNSPISPEEYDKIMTGLSHSPEDFGWMSGRGHESYSYNDYDYNSPNDNISPEEYYKVMSG